MPDELPKLPSEPQAHRRGFPGRAAATAAILASILGLSPGETLTAESRKRLRRSPRSHRPQPRSPCARPPSRRSRQRPPARRPLQSSVALQPPQPLLALLKQRGGGGGSIPVPAPTPRLHPRRRPACAPGPAKPAPTTAVPFSQPIPRRRCQANFRSRRLSPQATSWAH